MWFFLLNRPDCCSYVTSPPPQPFPHSDPTSEKASPRYPLLTPPTPMWSLPCRLCPGRQVGSPLARYQTGQCTCLVPPMGTAHSFLDAHRLCLFPTSTYSSLPSDSVLLFQEEWYFILFLWRESIPCDCGKNEHQKVSVADVTSMCSFVCVCVCVPIYMVSIYIVVQLGGSQQRSVYVFMKCLKRDKLTAW